MNCRIPPALPYRGTLVILATENEGGTTNISPMSSAFWLALRCVLGLGGASKCTANIFRTKQVVLNLPTEDLVIRMSTPSLARPALMVPPWKVSPGYRHVKDKFIDLGLTA